MNIDREKTSPFMRRISIVKTECDRKIINEQKNLPKHTLDTINGLVDIEGRLFPCLCYKHEKLAINLKANGFRGPYLKLQCMQSQDKPKWESYMARYGFDHQEPNDAQLGTMIDWCIRHDEPIPDWVKEK